MAILVNGNKRFVDLCILNFMGKDYAVQERTTTDTLIRGDWSTSWRIATASAVPSQTVDREIASKVQ